MNSQPSNPARLSDSPPQKSSKVKDSPPARKKFCISDLTNVNRQFPLNKLPESPTAERRSVRRTQTVAPSPYPEVKQPVPTPQAPPA